MTTYVATLKQIGNSQAPSEIKSNVLVSESGSSVEEIFTFEQEASNICKKKPEKISLLENSPVKCR